MTDADGFYTMTIPDCDRVSIQSFFPTTAGGRYRIVLPPGGTYGPDEVCDDLARYDFRYVDTGSP